MTAASKSNPLLFVLLLFVVLAIGGGAALMMTGGNDAPPPGLPGATSQAPPEPEPKEPASNLTAEHVERAAPAPERHAVETTTDGADAAQGVSGTVVDPGGAPVAGTAVYLMETAGVDMFRQLMLASKGVRVPPVAQTETNDDGSFALGVERPDPNKKYEVRVISDRFVDHQLPNITIQDGQWFDAGRIQLQRGTVLFGRVSIESSGGLPVPNAKVMVKQNNMFPSLSPTPGREDGLVADVDGSGAYRMENVPAGIVTISAVAPGYARIDKQNTSIQANAPNQIDFELPNGVSIAGIVTDASGAPVSGAKVEASAISSKTPAMGNTRSSNDGSFEVIGLVDGPYMMTAIAPGFVRGEVKPVQAGDKNVQIVLEKQGSAKVRVFDKNERILRRYTLTVKTYFEGQDQYGNTDVPPRQARTDSSGVATVEGLDPGSYVFQIEARDHCKAFSDPFTVAVGAQEPLVDVHLDEGGSIEGYVVDLQNQPVAGVTVQTLPNHLDENPFTNMFKSIIPFKITQDTTRTDARGYYKLELLTPGPYQLKFSHSDYYEVYQKNNEVVKGQRTTIAPVTMQKGTTVSGMVRVDGAPAAQVKVTLSAASTPDSPAPQLFTCEAISDNEGRFVFGKRVPPGRYQIMGARQTLANPLLQIADFHKTKQDITLARGQEKFFVPINISSQ